MKGIFVVALALCISACASQPEKTVAADQAATASHDYTVSASSQAAKPSRKVFLDDSTLLHVKAPASKRKTLVLGKKKS